MTSLASRSASPPWLLRHRGQLLDGLVILANLLLQEPFDKLLQPRPEVATTGGAAARLVGAIMLAAMVLYTIGAILKRAPLHARVPDLPSYSDAGCFYVGWVALHVVLSTLGAASVMAGFGGVPEPLLVTGGVVLWTLPTVFAARVVLRPRNLAAVPAWRKAAMTEWMADLLITLAIIPCTLVWNVSVADILDTFTGPTFADKLVAAVLAAGSFAILYVTPRFLFLVEDHGRWLTWVTVMATPLPMLGRMLLG